MASATRKVVQGTRDAITRVLVATGGGKVINTDYIERLNATFRAALVPLASTGPGHRPQGALLTAGMYLVGRAYNSVWPHESPRLRAPEGSSPKCQDQTPAMAAGLTDHPWTMLEVLSYQTPLPVWVAPKRQGHPPKQPPKLSVVGQIPSSPSTRTADRVGGSMTTVEWSSTQWRYAPHFIRGQQACQGPVVARNP